MSFMDKIKGVFVAEDDDYEYEDEGMEQEIISREHNRPSEAFDYNSSSTDNHSGKSGSQKSNRVVNIHATTQLQVVLVKKSDRSHVVL